MTPEQWRGVGTCVGIIGVGGLVTVLGAYLLTHTDRAIARLRAERVAYRVDRERRREDRAAADAAFCCWAHGIDGGTE